jgi:large subunit ribosomal protein L29
VARKKATELTEFDIPELVEKLAEAKEEYFNLRFRLATGQLENTARIPEVRRQIARINTVLRAKEIAAAEEVG